MANYCFLLITQLGLEIAHKYAEKDGFVANTEDRTGLTINKATVSEKVMTETTMKISDPSCG